MDDVAFPLIAPAPRLARQVADALSIIHATFHSFLLEVNLAVGKRRCYYTFVALARRLLVLMFSLIAMRQLSTWDLLRRESVNCCVSYKHLGTLTTIALRTKADFEKRARATMAAYGAVRRPFFLQTHV